MSQIKKFEVKMEKEVYKTGLRRFFATLIDSLVLLPIMYFEKIITSPEILPLISIIGLFLTYLIYHFYMVIFHKHFGQTIGKMLMKVVVLNISGNSITFRQAFLREFPLILTSILFLVSDLFQIINSGVKESNYNTLFEDVLIFILLILLISEIIVMLSNQKRRTIHDYIAGTVVIRTNLL
jgi:uncharacterized RDD family membrane protein YckC